MDIKVEYKKGADVMARELGLEISRALPYLNIERSYCILTLSKTKYEKVEVIETGIMGWLFKKKKRVDIPHKKRIGEITTSSHGIFYHSYNRKYESKVVAAIRDFMRHALPAGTLWVYHHIEEW